MPRMQSLPAKVLSESIYGKEFRSHQTRANIRGVQSREVMCEANNNDFSALKQISKDEDIFERTCNQERRASTGTLNRLILVAQALESEVDSRRQTDINGGRVVFSIRMANLILLFLLNALILTGVGQYNSPHVGKHQLMLTADKWFYRPDAHLPITFSEMQLSGQYLASGLSILMLLITIALQLWHICHTNNSRLIGMCCSFGSVPFSLFVFGLEMHYSACPWLDDFYRNEILRRDFKAVEPYFDTQCGISGWALAGIFSLLSCGLFVSEGLISAFFRADSFRPSHKADALL
ncbi:hypothetical protein Tcan_18918 [Toxocara canis]|uniref:Uncharacterized protein n=1 Tax=Toxocara canis TaxID=6265 RepID=A0A0B2UNG3_TOXCA|nr:hypothetical protein Tcan_18918 [Toxocara canis]